MRKQAAVTLRCMQALVRVQARVRARRVRMTVEGQAVQKLLEEHRTKSDLLKEVEVVIIFLDFSLFHIGLIHFQMLNLFIVLYYSQEGWCDRKGTVDDIKTKLQQRQEGAFKRERALAYALAQKVNCVTVTHSFSFLRSCSKLENVRFCLQQWRSTPSSNIKTNNSISYLKSQEFDKNSWGWSWLERWMAARPWETRLMDTADAATTPPPPPHPPKHLKSPETVDVIKVRRNNVTTRVSAKPPPHMLSSSPGYEFNESPGSSSICTSTTPASGTTGLVSDNSSSQANKNKPSYMSLTESTKAKRRTNRVLRQSMDEFQFMKNSGLFTGDLKSSPASDPSYVSFSKPLGVPTRFEKQRG